MPALLVLLVVIVGGAAAALQSQAMGLMTARAGTLESVFVTYGSGGLAIGLAMLVMRGGSLGDLRGAPTWVFTAGLLGLVVVGGLGYATAEMGLARTITLFTAASLIVGVAVDHFGWLGATVRAIDLGRMAGIALLVAGTWLVVQK